MWGVAFLTVDRLVLDGAALDDQRSFRGMLASPQFVERERRDVIDPPDWAAFALMSLGSVTMLYSVALPKSVNL